MSEKIINSVISALVGGAVGAAVVFFMAGKASFDTLEVGSLTITKQAALLNAEGKEDVVLKEGSVLANNVVLGKKFIGTQYQGHVFVGNRMFTSPDDLVATPMEKWRFYTEIGATNEAGGEVVVRSPNGANVVGQPVNTGMLFRTGFDQNGGLQLVARSNENGSMAMVPLLAPRPNQQSPAEGGQESAAATSTPTSTPGQETPAVAEASTGVAAQ